MIRAILDFLFPVPKCTTVEDWAQQNANLVTPDDIIVAHVIQSITKTFENWKLQRTYTSSHSYHKNLSLTDGNIIISWESSHFPGYSQETNDQYVIDSVALPKEKGEEIRKAYYTLHAAHERLKATAAAAKRAMERDEQAWNLAEKLLGMKRNEFGALVPAVIVEEGVTE